MTISTRIARGCLLAVLVVGCANTALLWAQDKPASAEQKKENNTSDQQSVGPARQLAHESREAAGEEKDETAEFKQSASVQFIAKYLTGGNLQRAYWTSVVLNFVVIAGIIFWAGRKFLPGMLRDRTASIQKAMQEAQRASAEAREKLAEIEARLATLDVEISTMRASAAVEGMAEEARIQAAAQDDARKIVAQAEQEISAAAKAARRHLTAHAAELAIGLAQKQIRVDAATDKALVRSFSGQLSSASENPGKGQN